MRYDGKAIQTSPLDGGFVELRFDLEGDSVNKLNALTLGELREVVDGLKAARPKGVLITSGKDVFIVGADVTEFLRPLRGERGGDRRLAPRRPTRCSAASRTSTARRSSPSTASASAAASSCALSATTA